MQNLVVIMDPPYHEYDESMKAGSMFFNRSTINEDAVFELLGVYYLQRDPERKGKESKFHIINNDLLLQYLNSIFIRRLLQSSY